MTTLNGAWLDEDQRMRWLREEEAELGIQPWEIVSNEIIRARLVRVDSTPVLQMPGEAVKADFTVTHCREVEADGPVEVLGEQVLGAMA